MHTLLSTAGNILIRMAEPVGLDAVSLFGSAAISNSDRMPSNNFDHAAAMIATRMPNPAFGLGAAEHWHPADLGALGFAWLSSENLRIALRRAVRFSRVLGEQVELKLDEDGDPLRILLMAHRDEGDAERIFTDVTLSLLLSMCRANAGQAFAPVRVELARPRPEEPSPYWRFFACPVEFDARENCVELAASIADAELPTANRALAGTLDSLLTRELAKLDEHDVVARTRAALLNMLADGPPEEEQLARKLCVSRRTLQRRLAERGTSFQHLADETRKNLALSYLDDPSRSVTEITFLTGFSTPSAFTRAFTRWTGKTPSAWRDSRDAP